MCNGYYQNMGQEIVIDEAEGEFMKRVFPALVRVYRPPLRRLGDPIDGPPDRTREILSSN